MPADAHISLVSNGQNPASSDASRNNDRLIPIRNCGRGADEELSRRAARSMRLSFEVRAGEIFGLVGPDGAGKTTTLRMLAGHYAARCGHGHGCGSRCGRATRRAPSMRSVTCRSASDCMRILRSMKTSASMRICLGCEEPSGISAPSSYLQAAGMSEFRERLAGKLSGGMKQKLGLVCALIHRPKVILLDEPTTGVDPVSRRDFWRILYELLGRGRGDSDFDGLSGRGRALPSRGAAASGQAAVLRHAGESESEALAKACCRSLRRSRAVCASELEGAEGISSLLLTGRWTARRGGRCGPAHSRVRGTAQARQHFLRRDSAGRAVHRGSCLSMPSARRAHHA